MDTPLTVQRAADLAGLVQCLASYLAAADLPPVHEDHYLVYTYNRFQACRFGLEAQYVEPYTGKLIPLREHTIQVLNLLDSHAYRLQATEALARVRTWVESTELPYNDSTWLVMTHQQSGDLAALVSEQCDMWSR
jgi:carboxylate-amine ligase